MSVAWWAERSVVVTAELMAAMMAVDSVVY